MYTPVRTLVSSYLVEMRIYACKAMVPMIAKNLWIAYKEDYLRSRNVPRALFWWGEVVPVFHCVMLGTPVQRELVIPLWGVAFVGKHPSNGVLVAFYSLSRGFQDVLLAL